MFPSCLSQKDCHPRVQSPYLYIVFPFFSQIIYFHTTMHSPTFDTSLIIQNVQMYPQNPDPKSFFVYFNNGNPFNTFFNIKFFSNLCIVNSVLSYFVPSDFVSIHSPNPRKSEIHHPPKSSHNL